MLRSIPILVAVVLLTGTAPGQKVFHTVDEALALAFGEADVLRSTEVLSDEDRARVEELAGTKAPRGVVFPYVARKDGAVVGTAYFDTHRVRTLRETLMVVVSPDGRATRVAVCAFAEPLDYVPRASFYAQFVGRVLDDDLRLRRGIDGVTGATLTSRATTDGVRRVLAIHRVLAEKRLAEEAEKEREREKRKETPPAPPPGEKGRVPAASAVHRDEGAR